MTIVPDPNAVALFEDRFENAEIGLVRVRRADLMLSSGEIRLWEWSELTNHDGTVHRSDRADYWPVADLDKIVNAAKSNRDAPNHEMGRCTTHGNRPHYSRISCEDFQAVNG